jgi:transcriptional adapter 2-alpha
VVKHRASRTNFKQSLRKVHNNSNNNSNNNNNNNSNNNNNNNNNNAGEPESVI